MITIEVRDDSNYIIDTFEVLDKSEVRDLEDQLPEGWSVNILD